MLILKLFIGCLIIIGSCSGIDYTAKCNSIILSMVSSEKSPADGRFMIEIDGDPVKYIPEKEYKIHILGTVARNSERHKFAGFVLRVHENDIDVTSEFHDVGKFSLLDPTLSKHDHECPNSITHTTLQPKTDVKFIWSAPTSGSGCIKFRVAIIENREVWYKDDGPLTKILCEDEFSLLDVQPNIVDCCACSEAKYRLTFEGLWTRYTHPRDFPPNGWDTRFSDLIGATHSGNYRFWQYGTPATEGLQRLAEHGSSDLIEEEIREHAQEVRTIIRARGLAYPYITGNTTSLVRVDPVNHLISIVSKIQPSPDWIVGVSALELCTDKCDWVEKKIFDLHPWDVGTDSGPTYLSPDTQTQPRDVIRRIRTENDRRSPFYNEGDEDIRPMARLILTRERLYPKQCDTRRREECEVTPFHWSPCNAECGPGQQVGVREYRDKFAARKANCREILRDYRDCEGSNCNRGTYGNVWTAAPEYNPPEEDPCELTEWSEWGPCNSNCGLGNETRTREYVNRYMSNYQQQQCFRKLGEESFTETRSCRGTDCGGQLEDADEEEEKRIEDDEEQEENGEEEENTEEPEATEGPTRNRGRKPYRYRTTTEQPKPRTNPCTQPLMQGDEECKEGVENRYYFNYQRRRCILTQISNCGETNDNNYISFKECADTCILNQRNRARVYTRIRDF